MIYQPRQHGDACYERSIPVLVMRPFRAPVYKQMRLLVQVRNKREFIIIAGWDTRVAPILAGMEYVN